MEREACVCDHGYERSDLCAEIIIIIIIITYTTNASSAEVASREFVTCLKKNQDAPRPSEHPPVRGEKCQNF